MKTKMKRILSMFLVFAMVLTLIPNYGAKAAESTTNIPVSKIVASGGQNNSDPATYLIAVGGTGTEVSATGSSAGAAYVSGTTASAATSNLGSARRLGMGFQLPTAETINPEKIANATVTINVESVNQNISDANKFWTKAGLFAVDKSAYDTMSTDESSFAAKDGDYSQAATIYCNEKIASNDLGEKTFDVTELVKSAIVAGDDAIVFRIQTVIGGFCMYFTGDNAPKLSITTAEASDVIKEVIDSLEVPESTKYDLTLPTTGAAGTTIEWSSNNTDVITNDGKVTRQTTDTTVELTATVSKDGSSETKKFTVTVVAAVEGTEDGLLASWEFNTDGSITDVSGNENTATLKGVGGTVANGILTLPGGNHAATSNANSPAFVELPGDMFVEQDTLTISVWLKNQTGSGNYAAMSFGTPTKQAGSGTADMPLNYWLLNPANPSGYFKSVWTDSNNSGAPYNTETATSSTKTGSDWALYTTVITPDRIVGYLNGVEVTGGNNAKTKTTTDFGTDIVAYIGRSGYGDPFYKGGVYGVKVYNKALTQQDIFNEYFSNMPYGVDGTAAMNAAITNDMAAVDLGDLTAVRGNLTLPTAGTNGSSISWSSSNTGVIANDGTVTRDLSNDVEVTLTATFTAGTQSQVKTYTANVICGNAQNLFEENVATLTFGSRILTSDMNLPATIGENTTITWTSDNAAVTVEAKDGVVSATVTRPAVDAENVKAVLTATVKYDDGTVQYSTQKKFDVIVLAEEYAQLMAYTNSNEIVSNTKRDDVGNSLHLAYSLDGENYTALNSNTGICFANNAGGSKNSNPNVLKNLYLFRKGDGTYGLLATNAGTEKYIYAFDSEDLVAFTNERKLEVNANVSGKFKVEEVLEGYKIYWTDGSKQYSAITADFDTVISQGEDSYTADTYTAAGTKPAGAVIGNIIGVTKAEYQYVINKLGVIKNTGMKEVSVKAKAGDDLNKVLPEKVTAEYNDGSTTDMNVVWNTSDIAKVDLTKKGTYTVTGTVQQKQYANPFITQRADPCVLKGDDGYYYFTASYPVRGKNDPEGYDRIVLRRATTIEGLADAEEVTILDINTVNNEMPYVWAPEIHCINGRYFIFYAASISGKWSIKPHVIECTDKDNIMSPKGWTRRGRVQAINGDTRSFETGFAIDMTIFEQNGRYYVIWAQIDGFSSLYIAEVDPEQPWKCISRGEKIAVPEYAWERLWENVDEGPSIIKSANGKIYCAFSASATGSEYCIGLLSADQDANLLDPKSWTKQPYPVLTSADVPGEYGPGHNSFTIDEEGNPIFVYHARGEECYNNQCAWGNDDPLVDPCRDARLKRVHWAVDGSPILKMSYEEELAPEFKTVTATIIVEETTTKPGSGNETTKPVEATSVSITNPYGAGTLQLAKGKKVKLTATVAPADATDKKVVWSSSKPKIAKVDAATGEVKGLKAGTAKITATTSNGKSKTVTVKIKKGAVKKVTLKSKKTVSLKAGKSTTIKTSVKAAKGANTKLMITADKPSAVKIKGKKVTVLRGTPKKTKIVVTIESTDGSNKRVKVTIKVK